jgi:hypothetical protein
MTAIPDLGGVGLGLVWGWLLGIAGDGPRRPLLTGLALTGATLLLALEVLLFTQWIVLAFFLGSTGLAWLLHFLWRRELHRRFGPPANH